MCDISQEEWKERKREAEEERERLDRMAQRIIEDGDKIEAEEEDK